MLEKNTTRFVVLFGLTLALLVPIAAGQPVSPLTLDNGVRKIHILPTLESRSQFAAAAVNAIPVSLSVKLNVENGSVIAVYFSPETADSDVASRA